MDEFGCYSLVFSSSSTVYGTADQMPLVEDAGSGLGITCAYGRSKFMIEEILKDFYQSKILKAKDVTKPNLTVTILRYFNPVGAHPSGKIGEDPNGIPNNLMPFIAQVAIGRREYLTVFGYDYPTKDGTAVRDYLHVMDLAEGHIMAIRYMQQRKSGCFVFNLGTGLGYSVLEVVHAMEKACGHDIAYKFGDRRAGDVAICYADVTKARNEMKWEAKRGLEEMCVDFWRWQKQNPKGFVN
jgi:UDP-glucose 4-epimerase